MANRNLIKKMHKNANKNSFWQQIVKFPLVLTLFFGVYTEGSAQCSCTNCGCTDSLELVKLYQSANGASWTNKWTLTQPMTNWYGVTLESGRVVRINLAYNRLTGSIANLNLPNLRELLLYADELTGTIPNFNLPNLTNLSLDYNQLTGSIPSFTLPKLKKLSLFNNQLSGRIPDFNMPDLTELALSNNKLSESIPNFYMPKLIALSLNSNQLTGSIPNFNMPNLFALSLSFNQLTGCIPSQIRTNCPRLGPVGPNGVITDNPGLATQNWANYWNNGEGACLIEAVTSLAQNEGRIYPNPVQDILFIENINGVSKSMIYNVLGELISEIGVENNAIDVHALNSGIYTLRLVSNQKNIVRVFVKK